MDFGATQSSSFMLSYPRASRRSRLRPSKSLAAATIHQVTSVKKGKINIPFTRGLTFVTFSQIYVRCIASFKDRSIFQATFPYFIAVFLFPPFLSTSFAA